MRFGSLASGIEAASVAWKPLGMTPAFFSEIDPFCCSLLKERHDDAPNLGNMNDITVDALRRCGSIDILIAGTPCQAFSVAGQRGGIADPRGQLALRAVQILDYLRPRWFVWENVPGVLSSGGGRDFGAFVGAVAQLGYGYAYRTLDAQFFGVPQRRRRIFLVGCLGDWRSAAAVLFEPDSLPRDSSKGSKTKQEIAGTITSGSGRRRGAGVNPSEIVGTLTARTKGGGGLGTDFECSGGLVPALTARPFADRESEEGKLIVHTLRGEGFDASEDGTGRGTPLVPVAYRCGGDGDVWESGSQVAALTTGTDPSSHILAFGGSNPSPINVSTCLNAKGGVGRQDFESETFVAMAFAQNQRDEVRYINGDGQKVGALAAEPGMKQQTYLQTRRAVRRLTPRECERLQGFPDDYTLIAHRGKPAADGPRYKAIGNSIAIPVLRWIGERLLMVDHQITNSSLK